MSEDRRLFDDALRERAEDAAPPEAQERDRWLGPYVRLRELGRGGMGVVWLAWDSRLRRTVALKVLSAGERPEDARRFLREAQMAAQLSHPHIVPVYEAGEAADAAGRALHYIAMKYVEGTTADRAALPLRRAVEAVASCADAMQYAHEQGIVHRDIKPGNMLVGTDEQVYLADFGLARRVGGSSVSISGMVLGTPPYMPPEQAEGRLHAIGPASDVYSLGAALYDLVLGTPPFAGGDLFAVLRDVVGKEPTRPRALRRDVPKDLETILLKCLDKDPARRYGSARELAEDLRRFLADEPVRARRVSVFFRILRRIRRNRAVSAALAAAALFLFAGLGVFILLLARENRKLERRARAQPPYQAGLNALEDADRAFFIAGASADNIRRRLAEAIRHLDAALAQDPDFADAWFARGRAKRLLNRAEESLGDLDAAIRLNATNPRYYLERAQAREILSQEADLMRTYFARDDPKWNARMERYRRLSREDYSRVAELSSDRDVAAAARARVLAADRRPAEALPLIDEAIRLNPENAFYYSARAGVQPDVAKAWEDFEHALRVRPNDLQLLLALGHLCDARGEAERAVQFYDRALAFDPASVTVRAFRAKVLQMTGDLDGAEDDYRFALRNEPGSYLLHYYLGHLLFLGGRLPEAVAEMTRAIEILGPGAETFWADRGMALLRSGRVAEAARDFETAQRMQPKYDQVYMDLAIARRLHPSDPSIAELCSRFRENPLWVKSALLLELFAIFGEPPGESVRDLERDAGRDAEKLFRVGLKRFHLGDFDGATKTFPRAAALRPDEPHYHLAQAIAKCARWGVANYAFADLDRCVGLAGEKTCRGLANLTLHVQQGTPGALDRAREAFLAAGDDPLALAGLGLLERIVGNLPAARERWRQAREKRPDLAWLLFE